LPTPIGGGDAQELSVYFSKRSHPRRACSEYLKIGLGKKPVTRYPNPKYPNPNP
jgi:hypothetical protein